MIIKREDGPVITIMLLLVILFLLLLAQKGRAQTTAPVIVPPVQSVTTLKQLYDGYNQEYFFGLLPNETRVQYGEMIGPSGEPDMGETSKIGPIFHIVISVHFHPSRKEAEITLLHEMCHVQIWQSGLVELDEHGPLWQDCMHRLAASGAFDDLW